MDISDSVATTFSSIECRTDLGSEGEKHIHSGCQHASHHGVKRMAQACQKSEHTEVQSQPFTVKNKATQRMEVNV